MQSTSILEALSTRLTFVVYRAIRQPDGKLDKIPFDPLTGYNATAHDPRGWMLPGHALLWAQHWDLQRTAPVEYVGVGLVLSDNCGIFALDLDHCRLNHGGWMPHAVAFCDRFPGAAIETSVSGHGRHVLMSYTGTLPAHGVTNTAYRMQAYSTNRFIGLTGIDAAGSILTDHTAALGPFLAEFFPEKPPVEIGEWTRAPVDEWAGPQDDGELLRRALRSHGARAVFGGRASFADLWNAEAETLGRLFPSASGDSWDRSAVDQALANHLAFWTGNDCERMLRMMRACDALRRAKWDRADYLPGTILNSTASQREWYKEISVAAEATPATDAPPGSPGVPPPPTITVDLAGSGVTIGVPTPPAVPGARKLEPGELPPVGEYASISIERQLFAGMCYVKDIHAIQLADGQTSTKERFDSTFGGPQYAMTADGQKPTKSAWDAYTLNEIHRFPRVDSQYFKPADALGTIRDNDGRREINSYKPANVRRVVGDPGHFLDLVRRMLPNGDDATILLSYLGACVQNLGVKFTWAPFLQGAKGNGKTTIGKVLEYCISPRYTHWAKADQLGEKFNSVLVGKLLVVVDEMYSDDARELQETLKQMVTSDRIEVRPMYAEKTMKEVCFNMLLISNHKNGVRIDRDERRYPPLFCAQQSKADRLRDGLTAEYFLRLRRWLWQEDGAAIVFDYLCDLDIPSHYNPAAGCIYAPETSSTSTAVIASLGGVEQEIIEAIRQEQEGFRNGWIGSHAVDGLLVRCGKDRNIPRTLRRDLVLSLGYIPHPALVDGVCTIPFPDGSRPRIYIREAHPWAVAHLNEQQVRDGYIASQKTG